jgi:hypothetical protein
MTQLLRIQALWILMWCVIMIKHKKNGNWKIWIMVNFCINDLQVIKRCNDMEYNDQSHHPIIVSLATSIARYNDECYCKLKFRIKMWK